MNVFEDLIVDLKKENLLEETVVTGRTPPDGASTSADTPSEDINSPLSVTEELATETESESVQVELVDPGVSHAAAAETEPNSTPKRVIRGKDFFKKRAVSEMSSLQMVEHVISGVEREYLKQIPKTFDDFKAKKALNVFLQAIEAEDQAGHAEAEFALMQETEAWCSALAERDKRVPVSAIRQYCENTRPALSSQAMVAVARFYRNLPYSEPVRAKFDFVITRVFSRAVENDRRICLFARDEILTHINTLYSEWASVPLYSADDDGSKVMLTALSFEDLAVEAETAVAFDQLITNDFFGRLRLFKESISEVFFAPEVTAAAIEANVRIGNAYVALIAREKEKMDAAAIENKYADLDQQGVSDSLAQTLKLVEVLKNAPVAAATSNGNPVVPAPESEPKISFNDNLAAVKDKTDDRKGILKPILAINRWVLVFSVVMIAASIGLAVWSNVYSEEERISTVGVLPVQFSDPYIAEHIKIAKISSSILYVQLGPSWDVLGKEKRQDILQKLHLQGPEKGFNQVQLLTSDGSNAGYASASRLEVVMP